MIQAYEEPMVFTKNQTLNPILVLSSKISLLFQLNHVKIRTNMTYHNPTCYHPVVVEVYKTKGAR